MTPAKHSFHLVLPWELWTLRAQQQHSLASWNLISECALWNCVQNLRVNWFILKPQCVFILLSLLRLSGGRWMLKKVWRSAVTSVLCMTANHFSCSKTLSRVSQRSGSKTKGTLRTMAGVLIPSVGMGNGWILLVCVRTHSEGGGGAGGGGVSYCLAFFGSSNPVCNVTWNVNIIVFVLLNDDDRNINTHYFLKIADGWVSFSSPTLTFDKQTDRYLTTGLQKDSPS